MTIYCLKNRSEDSDHGSVDPYEAVFENAVFVSIMQYEPVDLPGLTKAVLANHDALIVTSQRAVDALKLVLQELPASVLDMPIYTVGPATAERLRKLKFSNVLGADSGNGVALGRKMTQQSSNNKKYLFLAGEIHRKELPNMLSQAGNTVDTQIVYKTSPVTEFEFHPVPKPSDWLVFFSPSHSDRIINNLLQDREAHLPTPHIAVIGPTTLKHLQSKGLQVDAVAEEPTALGLKKAIDLYEKS